MNFKKIGMAAGAAAAGFIAIRSIRNTAKIESGEQVPGSDLLRQQGQRDPEDRPLKGGSVAARRDRSLDKTLADSFPTSDPPSSIPDPA
jgi:hypothetical protein